MWKRIAGAVVAVFVLWSVLDIVIHGVILKGAYETTASLWRPMPEMKMGLIQIVKLIGAIVFVCLYGFFVGNKSVKRGLLFGLLFGLGTGISMGYGTFAVQPIPHEIAFVWCWGTVIEAGLAGALTGWIVKG